MLLHYCKRKDTKCDFKSLMQVCNRCKNTIKCQSGDSDVEEESLGSVLCVGAPPSLPGRSGQGDARGPGGSKPDISDEKHTRIMAYLLVALQGARSLLKSEAEPTIDNWTFRLFYKVLSFQLILFMSCFFCS